MSQRRRSLECSGYRRRSLTDSIPRAGMLTSSGSRGTPGLELDVALREGHAELQDQPISTEAARLDRYAEPMRRLGVSSDEFLGTYSQATKVVP